MACSEVRSYQVKFLKYFVDFSPVEKSSFVMENLFAYFFPNHDFILLFVIPYVYVLTFYTILYFLPVCVANFNLSI
jgi:hypothetical protein